MTHPNIEISAESIIKVENQLRKARRKTILLSEWITPNHLHIRFTHSKTVFRYPPEPFIKKLKRFLGIKPKGNPFVKLEVK